MIQSLKGCSLILDINKIINKKEKQIINNLINNGATVYLVGGAIRDYYLDYPINDLDLEIYNIDFETLKEILKDEDMYINDTFKTIKVNNIELALPRFETKVGLNYTDYQLTFDEKMAPNKAIERRDFTVNSLMYNLNEYKLYDFCHGMIDLDNKILKAVNYDKFTEDSIRSLRLLKYQSKLNFKIDNETYELAKSISNNLWAQPNEMVARMIGEIIFNRYFDIELFFDILSDFFMVDTLKNHITNNKYHPEKTLYKHLLGALMCLQLFDIKVKRDYEILFWTLFFHDFGKLEANENHSHLSLKFFDEYQRFLLLKEKDVAMVRRLIEDHMVIREYSEADNKEAMQQLKKKYGNQFYLLEIVGACDYGGRVADFNEEEFKKRLKWYQKNILAKY